MKRLLRLLHIICKFAGNVDVWRESSDLSFKLKALKHLKNRFAKLKEKEKRIILFYLINT